MKTMTVRQVAISDLRLAPYNPKHRTKADSPFLRQLEKSIVDIGLIHPIDINKANDVIDGHRRVAIAKKLGWETIPALIVEGERERIYADVNATARGLSGADKLQVWLSEPTAVTPRVAATFENAAELVGRDMLEKMAKNGQSLRLYRQAREIANYVSGETSGPLVRKALTWQIRHANSLVVRQYLAARHPPRVLREALEKDADLKVRFSHTK